MKTRHKWLLGIAAALTALACGLLATARLARRARPRVSERVLARAAAPARPGPGDVVVRWTGVAGVTVETGDTVVLIDPYLTRHAVAELALPMDADEPTLARAFPKATLVLVSHSHHDHLGDVPAIARRTGARVAGSRTTCALAVAMGLPRTQCEEISDASRLTAGPVEVEVSAGEHGRSALGVPLEGDVREPPAGELHAWEMKMGGAFSFIVRVNGRVLYHHGSAGLGEAQRARLEGLRPDLALVCLALRENTPQYADRLLGALQPRRVLPLHHDDFFGETLDDALPLLPGVDLEGFRGDVHRIVPGAVLLEPRPFEPVVLR